MRIYTKTGDAGETGLYGGGRVPKDALRVAAYGAVDELNAALGVARALAAGDADLDAVLARLQAECFTLGAELATPQPSGIARPVPRISGAHVAAAEQDIDRLETELPELRHFILPGGAKAGAALHFARTVCRRAERELVRLHHAEPVSAEALQYLNRVSDLLFVMARAANRRAGAAETPWEPPR
jgi:cob(I)alamin adenosyltransferase